MKDQEKNIRLIFGKGIVFLLFIISFLNPVGSSSLYYMDLPGTYQTELVYNAHSTKTETATCRFFQVPGDFVVSKTGQHNYQYVLQKIQLSVTILSLEQTNIYLSFKWKNISFYPTQCCSGVDDYYSV